VLIAALLELKSRLMLSSDEQELLDIEPEQAAEELLARMLDARRYRAAAAHLGELLASEHGVRFRMAPPPPSLRRTIIQPQDGSQDPRVLGERLAHLRRLLSRGSFSFEEAVDGADRMTVAVTLFALLELYKRGEADWEQRESFGEIAVHGRERNAPASAVQGVPPLALAAGASAPGGLAG
jgi:segregation and condensation protein A